MTISIDTFLKNPKECIENAKKGESIIIVDYDGTHIIMKKAKVDWSKLL